MHPYACALCEESFTNARSLVSHVQNKHVHVKYSNAKNDDSNNLIESHIRKLVKDTSSINMKDKIEADEFSCKICDKSYSSYRSLYQHS